MKKKQLSTNRDTKSPKQKKTHSHHFEKNMHDVIELLNEKVDVMQSMINDLDLTPSSSEMKKEDSSKSVPPSEADLVAYLQTILSDDISLEDLRFQSLDGANIGDTQTTGDRLNGSLPIQNAGASNSGQSAGAIVHRTSYNYASASSQNYSYGFTNSEFFAFIGNLDPVEYILVITVVAIIIGVELNVFERQIVGGTLVDIGVTLGNMVEQELFRSARRNEIVNRQRNEAEQNDFDTLYDSIDQLQAEIDRLKEQIGQNQT